MTTHSAIVSNVSTDSDHTTTIMHEAKPRIDPLLLTIRWGADTLPPPLGMPGARIYFRGWLGHTTPMSI